MGESTLRVALGDVQRSVATDLDRVAEELRRIVAADFPIIAAASDHILQKKGKLFRPTLLLLGHQASGSGDRRVVTLAAGSYRLRVLMKDTVTGAEVSDEIAFEVN